MVRHQSPGVRPIMHFDVSFFLDFSRYTVYKDHITLGDYEIHDGMSLEMY